MNISAEWLDFGRDNSLAMGDYLGIVGTDRLHQPAKDQIDAETLRQTGAPNGLYIEFSQQQSDIPR